MDFTSFNNEFVAEITFKKRKASMASVSEGKRSPHHDRRCFARRGRRFMTARRRGRPPARSIEHAGSAKRLWRVSPNPIYFSRRKSFVWVAIRQSPQV